MNDQQAGATWLETQAVDSRSVDEMVDEGYEGVLLGDLLPWFLNKEAMRRIAAIAWLKAAGNDEGIVALMTKDSQGLDALLEWMLETKGECPKVYTVDTAADNAAVKVPDVLPVLRPTAFNLPDDLTSEEALDDDFLNCIQEIFKDLQQSFGSHACLHRFDYGTFMDNLDKDVLFLTGQFIDIETQEIYEFTMDGIQQRIRYQSTGVTVGSSL